jgi:undecaprenyl-diphosphatase
MLIENIALGLVQGLTEFLPVSSSGHLFLFGNLFGINISLSAAVWFHFATLFVVIVYLRKDWYDILKGTLSFKKDYWRSILVIITATLPAAIFGFFISSFIDSTFGNTPSIAINLVITGIIMFISDYLPDRTEKKVPIRSNPYGTISYRNALIIGLFQAVAVLPGISRSGLTLFGCLLVGLSRETAFRFSFLLSIPVILGSSILELRGFSLSFEPIVGFGVAILAGWFALWVIKKMTLNSKLKYFGIYCWLIAILAIVIQ